MMKSIKKMGVGKIAIVGGAGLVGYLIYKDYQRRQAIRGQESISGFGFVLPPVTLATLDERVKHLEHGMGELGPQLLYFFEKGLPSFVKTNDRRSLVPAGGYDM